MKNYNQTLVIRLIVAIVFIIIATPHVLSLEGRYEYPEVATEELDESQREAIIQKANTLLRQVKKAENNYNTSFNRNISPDVREGALKIFKEYFSEYNSLAEQYGLEPYESPLVEGSVGKKRDSAAAKKGFLLGQSTSGSSQATSKSSKDEIELTVTSDGPSKDEAVKNALRLAIEQAYGAFVSANTTILNDELVKDEIVTVTHGAIKDFKEIGGAQLSDNRYSITIQATVSLPKLITYAKNHGSECEFAGKSFAMELKLFEIERENERKALYNLIPIIEQICKNTMHWEIKISEPYIPNIKINRRDRRFEYNNYYIEDKDNYPKIYNFCNEVIERPTDFCGIDIKIWWLPIGKRIEFAEILKDYLREMSMDRESYYALYDKGFHMGQLMDRDSNFEETDIYKPYVYYSRLDQKTLEEWYQILMDKIHDIKYSFVITDANGNVSNFYPKELIELESRVDKGDYQMWRCAKYNSPDWYNRFGYVLYGGSGLFNPLTLATTRKIDFSYYPFTEYVDVAGQGRMEEIYWDGSYSKPRNLEKGVPCWNISVIVPMKEAQNFTSFKIQAKN